MPNRLFTVVLPESEVNLQAAAQRLQVPVASLDHDFGLVPINPAARLYSVLVEDGIAPAVDKEATQGPFANPGIGAFGPLEATFKTPKA